jgi:hypothetical protein
MQIRFVEVDGREIAREYLLALGYEREAKLFSLLEFLEDMTDESRMPAPMFERLTGEAAQGFWKMTLDVGSEAYLLIVRRRGDTWYIVNALLDQSAAGILRDDDVARALSLWEAFAQA